jgi:hypothetical protein
MPKRYMVTDMGSSSRLRSESGEDMILPRYGVWDSTGRKPEVVDTSDDLGMLLERYGLTEKDVVRLASGRRIAMDRVELADELMRLAGSILGPGVPDGTGPMKDTDECPYDEDVLDEEDEFEGDEVLASRKAGKTNPGVPDGSGPASGGPPMSGRRQGPCVNEEYEEEEVIEGEPEEVELASALLEVAREVAGMEGHGVRAASSSDCSRIDQQRILKEFP